MKLDRDISMIPKWIKVLFLIILLSFLFLPELSKQSSILQFKNIDKFVNEKRELSSKPDLDSISLLEFPEKYEAYYNDHFGYRKFLITSNNYIKTFYFNESSNKKVIIGKEGWLFYNINNIYSDYQGKELLSNKQMKTIRDTLLARQNRFESMGKKYYVFFIPNKIQIYPEYLKEEVKRGNSCLDQFLSFIDKDSLPVYDLKEVLLAHKDSVLLYQKIDSHWNRNGGFLASNNVLRVLKQDFPELGLLSKEKYTINEVEKVQGDLAGMIGVQTFMNNSKFNYRLKTKNNKRVKKFNEIKYNTKYKQSFCYDNESVNDLNLLVFNDSYVSYYHQFLSEGFGKSSFYWTHNLNQYKELTSSADVIIQIVAERSLLKAFK